MVPVTTYQLYFMFIREMEWNVVVIFSSAKFSFSARWSSQRNDDKNHWLFGIETTMDHWDWLNHESSGWLNGWTLIDFFLEIDLWLNPVMEINWLKLTEMTESSWNWNQWIYQWIKERISKVGPWRRPSESQALGLWHPWPPLLIDVARWAKIFQEAPAEMTPVNWKEVKGSLCTLCSPWSWPISHFSDVLQKPSASGFFMIGMVAKGPVSPPCSAAPSECCRVSPAPISSISSACKVQICAFVMNAYVKMV